MGFDTILSESNDNKKLKNLCRLQKRILVTRIKKPGKLINLSEKIIISSDALADQLRQVVREAGIKSSPFFSRCADCNRKVYPIDKSTVEDRLPERVRQREKHFTICSKCGKLFWKGTHYQAMLQFLCRELDGVENQNQSEFTLTESD
jgi:uncharacterized protein with PIN domain